MNRNYSFNIFNNFSIDGIAESIKQINEDKSLPIIVCIGSDYVLGDSLGPLIGTMLKKKELNAYIYGTLNQPITAKEIYYAKTEIKKMHKNSVIIAIDAAVGEKEDVGLIKVKEKGLFPGLGVNKKLGEIGDISILGVVATKSLKNYNLYNLTRLNLVYKMAEIISSGIEKYIIENNKEQSKEIIA